MTDAGPGVDTQDNPDNQGADAEEGQAPAPDPRRDPLAQAFRTDLADMVRDVVVERDDIWLRVDAAAWYRTIEYLRDHHGFDYFCFLSGIDWKRDDELSTRYEKVWPEPSEDRQPGMPAAGGDGADGGAGQEGPKWETGIGGGDTRFQVFCRLYSIHKKVGVTVKADLDSDRPEVASIVGLFRGADWHERETWEMFGFDFPGHPSLRHLYLPSDFEGFPLRKDFPLLARVVKPWPGLVDKEPIPGEDEEESEEGSS